MTLESGGFSSRQLSGSGFTGLIDELRDGLGRTSANANPVIDTLEIKAQGLSVPLRDRVVETNPLDKSAITLRRAICHGDVIERCFLSAVAREANN